MHISVLIIILRGGSRTAATSKMGRFVIIVNGWLVIIIKAVNYYHKALHLGCSSSLRSASDSRCSTHSSRSDLVYKPHFQLLLDMVFLSFFQLRFLFYYHIRLKVSENVHKADLFLVIFPSMFWSLLSSLLRRHHQQKQKWIHVSDEVKVLTPVHKLPSQSRLPVSIVSLLLWISFLYFILQKTLLVPNGSLK